MGALNAVVDHFGFNHFAFLKAELVHDAGNSFAGEETHELVLQRYEEHTRTRVTLTAGATTQLAVYTTALVTLCTDDGQAAGFLHLGRELDVGSATCHVGGDGYGTQEALFFADFALFHVASLLLSLCFHILPVALGSGAVSEGFAVGTSVHFSKRALAGQGHDVGFALVQFGIQHLVRNFSHLQHAAQQLADVNARCTDQNGAACDAHLFDLVDDSCILLALRFVNAVVHVVACYRTIGRYLYNIELIDVPEFAGFGDGRTGHSGKFVIHSEVVLQGDGGKRLCSRLDLDVLFGFHGLVQTIAPTASFHDTTGLLVHDLHLPVYHHILLIDAEHGVGFQQLQDGVYALTLDGVIGQYLVFASQLVFFGNACVGFERREFGCDVGQNEQLVVVHLFGQPCVTLVRQVYRMQLLVDNKVEGLYGFGHALVVVLHIDLFRLEHAGLDSLFGEELDKRIVLRQCLV